MTDALSTEKCKDGPVCSWCGVHFHPTMQQKIPVCPRCYRLLSSAGLKDEEIFAQGKPGEDESSSEE